MFTVNKTVNVKIYFYSYPMIRTYIISVFFSTGVRYLYMYILVSVGQLLYLETMAKEIAVFWQ